MEARELRRYIIKLYDLAKYMNPYTSDGNKDYIWWQGYNAALAAVRKFSTHELTKKEAIGLGGNNGERN